jgi:DNA repair protein RadD
VYEFLSVLDDHELKQLVVSVAHGTVTTCARERLVKIIVACKGYDLLSERSARQLLLEKLSLGDLERLRAASRVKTPHFSTPYDGAVTLAQVPWRVGSTFVWEFAKRFGVRSKYLPRRGGRVSAVEVFEPIGEVGALHDYQREVIDELQLLIAGRDQESVLVQMPTGSGKTRTVMEAVVAWLKSDARDSGDSVLWLAHTQELCEQAVETFGNLWIRQGDRDVTVARLWGDYSASLAESAGAVVFGGYSKISQRIVNDEEWAAWLQSRVGLLVVDEAHKAVADTVATIVSTAKANVSSKIIGMTATPGRGVEVARENRELARLFGTRLLRPTCLGADPVRELQRRGILSSIKREPLRVNVDLPDAPGDEEFDDVPVRLLKRLAANESRNRAILTRASEYIDGGHTLLIYACTVEHAKELALSLASMGYDAGFVDCTMRSGARASLVEGLRSGRLKALVNFGVLSTGFDAPNVSVVMITRPTTSIVLYSQMLGRGLRGQKMGGTDTCIVVDVRDNVDQFGELDSVYTHFDQYWGIESDV